MGHLSVYIYLISIGVREKANIIKPRLHLLCLPACPPALPLIMCHATSNPSGRQARLNSETGRGGEMNSLHGARAAVGLSRPHGDLQRERRKPRREGKLWKGRRVALPRPLLQKKGLNQNPRLERLVTGRAQCGGNHGERGGVSLSMLRSSAPAAGAAVPGVDSLAELYDSTGRRRQEGSRHYDTFQEPGQEGQRRKSGKRQHPSGQWDEAQGPPALLSPS